jgi:hypothetical protein
MIARILESLTRQERALTVLAQLLAEEFSLLAARDATGVTSLEFSIQELLRQLAVERGALGRIYPAVAPGAARLADVIDRFDAGARARALALLAAIERGEKRCSTLSSRNYQMALGLYDVTKSCLSHLQTRLVPKKAVYGSRGRVGAATPSPGRINGRF